MPAKPKTPFPIANQRLMEQTMSKLGEQYAAGILTADQFSAKMRGELKDGLVAQYRFAKASALDETDQATVNRLLKSQHDYLDGMVGQVKSGAQSIEGLPNRASLYAGSATEAALEGKLAGTDDEAELTWTTSGGNSCPVCDELSGTTMTAAEWRDADERPGSVHSGCGCSLG